VSAPIVERLTSTGAMPPGWESAFATVTRSDFVPDRIWPLRDGTYERVTDRSVNPVAWQAAVDDDIPLVTQWDDGAHTGDNPGTIATSSASAPSVVARELAALDLADGMRVLDIGTGTGWTAALLAARGATVTTVEIDAAMAGRARQAIDRAGYAASVTTVTGDGALGFLPDAPYDRVHVTAGVRDIPSAWIEQTVPGGVLVTPWGTHYHPHDQVLRLTVGENRASGPFLGGLSFTKLRAQRTQFPDVRWPGDWKRHARPSTPTATIADVTGTTHPAAAFVVGLLVPRCMPDVWGSDHMYLYGWDDTGKHHSLAEAAFRPNVPPAVHQTGPRDLWTEVQTAHTRWEAAGRPLADRFGLTVTVRPDGGVDQQPWFESPDHELPFPGADTGTHRTHRDD
jgi:protein-L-isoaspartate(D-aspartate) O-methyltransferase